jgi:hypothetical protein
LCNLLGSISCRKGEFFPVGIFGKKPPPSGPSVNYHISVFLRPSRGGNCSVFGRERRRISTRRIHPPSAWAAITADRTATDGAHYSGKRNGEEKIVTRLLRGRFGWNERDPEEAASCAFVRRRRFRSKRRSSWWAARNGGNDRRQKVGFIIFCGQSKNLCRL